MTGAGPVSPTQRTPHAHANPRHRRGRPRHHRPRPGCHGFRRLHVDARPRPDRLLAPAARFGRTDSPRRRCRVGGPLRRCTGAGGRAAGRLGERHHPDARPRRRQGLPQRLDDARWDSSGEQGPGSIRSSYDDGRPTFGDLDGDGRAEAVVYVSCLAAGGDSGDSSGQLLVVNGRTGSLAAMGYVGPLAQVYGKVRISGQRLEVTVTQKYTDVRQERTYRWNGRRFVQVAGPTAFPSPPA
jgi:hypothetical protein